MPKLPQDIDYGQRPSLQPNRLDRPGTGGQGAAEALAIASAQFGDELEKKKQKNDALNYALARNEIQQADLMTRDSLAEDKDWQTHDQKYSERFKTAAEAISQKYRLDPSDRALLQSESSLIGARGRVAVGANANKLKIEESLASLHNGLAAARETIINADPGTRNHLMLGQLEAIDAARDSGTLTDVEAEGLRQRTTQDFAKASLDAMPADERKRVLEASLAYRRGKGDLKTNTGQGPLTPEDIAAGKGTGSIADFLHSDTVAAMLKTANDEDKENQNRIEAYAVMDKAKDMFPEDEVAALNYISKNAKGTIRDIAEREASEHFNRIAAAKAEVSERIVNEYGSGILDGSQRYNSIPPEQLAKLSLIQKQALRKTQEKYDSVEGQGFSSVSQIADVGDGRGSVDLWNKLPDYSDESPRLSKATVNLESPMWRAFLSPRDYQLMLEEQRLLVAAEHKPLTTNVLNPKLRVERALVSSNFMPQTGRSPEQQAIAARLTMELSAAITRKENSFKPPRALDDDEENTELAKLLSRTAFLDRPWYKGPDKEVPFSTLPNEDFGNLYTPVERAKQKKTSIGGQEVTVYEYLVTMARNQDPPIIDPDDHDVARAYFALENNLGDEEVLKRLRGE